MRKVLLRWRPSSLSGLEEISSLTDICERIEVLGHLSFEEEGVKQLVELKIRDGRKLSELSDLESFEVLEKHEEDSDGMLVSILCTHPMAKMAIGLSNIYFYPPYGIDSTEGLEIRIYGLSSSIRSFLRLIDEVMPPDSISVRPFKTNDSTDFEYLTTKQKEALILASRRGYYEEGSEVTLKQLADEMGISRSTIGEHLKRAENEIIKRAVDDLT